MRQQRAHHHRIAWGEISIFSPSQTSTSVWLDAVSIGCHSIVRYYTNTAAARCRVVPAAYRATMQPMTDTRSIDEQLEPSARRMTENWHAMVRYFVLANAGGAVTVISFLGASGSAGPGSWLALVPLGFFFFGVVSAGIAAISEAGKETHSALMVANRILNEQLAMPKSTALVIGLRHVAAWPEVLAFVFFVLGGISGLVFLGMLLAGADGTIPTTGAAVPG